MCPLKENTPPSYRPVEPPGHWNQWLQVGRLQKQSTAHQPSPVAAKLHVQHFSKVIAGIPTIDQSFARPIPVLTPHLLLHLQNNILSPQTRRLLRPVAGYCPANFQKPDRPEAWLTSSEILNRGQFPLALVAFFPPD